MEGEYMEDAAEGGGRKEKKKEKTEEKWRNREGAVVEMFSGREETHRSYERL